jgi:hypothetical protein
MKFTLLVLNLLNITIGHTTQSNKMDILSQARLHITLKNLELGGCGVLSIGIQLPEQSVSLDTTILLNHNLFVVCRVIKKML